MVSILAGDDCGNRKRCHAVPGRKTSISSYVGSRRALTLKPAVSRETGWLDPPCGILQYRLQYRRIDQRFTREQRRALHLRVFANQPDRIQRGWNCTSADSCGVARKDVPEPIKCRRAAEIPR